jgi:aryl-alcohol dehydrogenase-like predicted oxidoreductase
MMETHELGKSGIKVAPWALGGNVFGWTANEAISYQLLDAFMDAGFNLVDTADVYSRWKEGHIGGESEAIIGKWMKQRGNRDKMVIATKVGMDMGDGKVGLKKQYIFQAVEDSLRRLQTDYIDLYQSHKDDPNTPQEETLEAYAELVKQGKVRAIGASNYSAERLAEALKISAQNNWPRYETLQPHYNMYERESFEKDLEPLCLKEGVGVIPYFSLASGFLTGKYRTEADFGKSLRGGSMGKYFNDRGFSILKALDEVAAKHKATPAQIALAWLAARSSITAPIASATTVFQLKELAKAFELKLDAEDVGVLDAGSGW